MVKFVKEQIFLIALILFIVVLLIVNIRINTFSYNNFDFGKFDLGNMSQMLWNTWHGRFMYLTDYFGTNLPRWSMSHVDPILLLFLPVFILFPSPLTLVFSQVVLVLSSALILYAIVVLLFKSKLHGFLIGAAFLLYPAVGFLTSRTTFHGVTSAIPFFLLAFYFFEKIYQSTVPKRSDIVFFWISVLIFLAGKEQLSLYLFLYGIYIAVFRQKYIKTGILLSVIGLIWFITAFFIIIPHYAKYRIDGYQKFADSLQINTETARNVALPNYFLSRYDAFGESYTEIMKNIALNPDLAVRIFFGGDKPDNFNRTFMPVLYIPLLVPNFFVLAVPDLMMNYLTSSSGVGTAEISNHRISMIIPILFLTVVLFFRFLYDAAQSGSKIYKNTAKVLYYSLPLALVAVNLYASFAYNNPVYLWIRETVKKHLPVFLSQAKSEPDLIKDPGLKIGDVVRVTALENKDLECARRIVGSIPEEVSVSGPDYLGAHLSMRETYAIFPALYNDADYVIVDVFSKKILTILDLETSLIKDIVRKVVLSPNYKLESSCGNLFVFKKAGQDTKSTLFPIQEIFSYTPKYDYEIYSGLTVIDYKVPEAIVRNEVTELEFVYNKKHPLKDYILFLSFINSDTGEVYQIANLPSFALSSPDEWREDFYYSEHLSIILPQGLEKGTYKLFLGMTNNVKNRSVYLKDLEVK